MALGVQDWWQQAQAASAQYSIGGWLFLRALGVIYGIAFLSLAVQIKGLAGREGILPAGEFLSAIKEQFGRRRIFAIPTLCWLNDSDRFLHFLCWGGVVLSVLLVIGIAPVPVLILLFLFYLSLFSLMRLFLGYQWDILLLETGFVAIFLAPIRLMPTGPIDAPPWPILILLYWLLFRLMFLSGLVKLRSGDATWRQLTALVHHYETQPLPTPGAWFAHQCGAWFHKLSTAGMFVIELGSPFLIFAPPPWRCVAALLIISLMLLIMLTGNYCFFNLLTMALCLLLFDDGLYERILPSLSSNAANSLAQWPPWLLISIAIIVLTLSASRLLRLFRVETGLTLALNQFLDSLPIVNHYGLFSVMTTIRMEIVVEGSRDGHNWAAYEFKWKPCDPKRPLPWVAPHQPRLDWQMWFAALSDYRLNGWFIGFLIRLLQGSRPVLALLRHNPFPDAPPTYVRAMLYQYRFTDWKTRRRTGAWWTRERHWLYCPVYSLRGPERQFMPPEET